MIWSYAGSAQGLRRVCVPPFYSMINCCRAQGRSREVLPEVLQSNWKTPHANSTAKVSLFCIFFTYSCNTYFSIPVWHIGTSRLNKLTAEKIVQRLSVFTTQVSHISWYNLLIFTQTDTTESHSLIQTKSNDDTSSTTAKTMSAEKIEVQNTCLWS